MYYYFKRDKFRAKLSLGIGLTNYQSSFDVSYEHSAITTDVDGQVVSPLTEIVDNMTENLKTTKFNDGTTIPNVTDDNEWRYLTTPAYSWYNNDPATYASIYGALYNGFTVGTGKICPSGWHVPTDEEWTTLTESLGGWDIAGGKLKEAGTTHWNGSNNGATNESGFTALPGGYRRGNQTFNRLSYEGYFWSSTETDGSGSSFWRRSLSYSTNNIVRGPTNKEWGFSIRCIRD